MNKTRFLTALLAAGLCLSAVAEDKGFKLGAEFRKDATLAEIGLPDYPGAVPQQDKEQDSAALSMGLWAGAFGVKLHLRKFASNDSLDSIAGFYLKAMAQHGKPLDCATAPPAPTRADGKVDDKQLSCRDSDRTAGKRVLKVGANNNNARIVVLNQAGQAVNFQLLRVQVKGD
ncbi:hypothetical protein [Pelomonas sp. SE-A7]|uniref:hypothetical protein n=1 Tax=Pelomonas sp. SE-A7 TaxID=3054953 RepID=UPI00259CF9B9|nr:hypothetical protein [Pelomonas sp. SE-A7]MDM4765788.1 hypothetical protein [Pelomonas sp. SE-A7]